jgi:rare lipoprotein A
MRILLYFAAATALFLPMDALPKGEGSKQDKPSAGKAAKQQKDFGSGIASYYAAKFAGRRTASGETYSPKAMTAAHRTAPFGSKIRVTHLGSGKDVVVRINDRGPHVKGRIIDLSYAAAEKIGLTRSGTARVRLTRVQD